MALSALAGCSVEVNVGNTEPAKKTFTITFNANGGSGEIKAQSAESGSEITLTANAFTRDGYTFSGWNTAADGKGAPHDDKAKITLTADITLYAQWAVGTGTAYKIEHWQQNIADDGYSLAKTESMTGTTGDETAAKTEETAGFTAKEFAQAKIAADGSTTVKIYYDRKMVTLTLNCGNDTEPQTVTGKFGADVKIDVPTKTGYTFAAWNPELPATFPAEDAQYIAKWVKEGDYIITYKNAENAANDNPAGYNVETETITLKEATKAGYIFDGWYKEDSFATKVTEITKGSAGNITLYAKWNLETYSITYILNDDDITPAQNANPAEYNIESAVTLAAPERSFYEFAGWYVNADFSGDKVEGWNAGVKTGDIKFYAKWTLTAAGAPDIIRQVLPDDGETHTISISGDMTADDFAALKGVLYGKKVCLDLSATTITEIPSNAFNNASNDCRGLAGIILPASVEKIGFRAFYNSELETVVIPKSNTAVTIDEAAFHGSELKSIVIPGNVKTISADAFGSCRKLASVVIEEGVQSIGYQGFYYCKALKSITIPSTVTEIGTSAFQTCESLETAVVKSKTTGKSMFALCIALKEVTLETEVKTVEQYTFNRCSSLETVNILTNELSIEICAFYDCTGLKNVRIAGSETDCKITSSPLVGGNDSFESAEKIYNYDFSQSN